jgi:hypothetical protein
MSNMFHKHTLSDVARVTEIAYVTDREIWSCLVTPMVKALLGKIVSWRGEIRETVEGLWPGDEVANLNDHRLYGGQTGFVRFPYHYSCYKTEYGAFVVKRDGVKFEAFGWVGNLDKKQGELIMKIALRDRRFDGTKHANDTALVDFPYDDKDLNSPLPVDAKSVELSIYGFMPNSRISDACGNLEFEQFVEGPYKFLDRPELFLKYFEWAWNSKRAPGQKAAAIPDISKLVPPQFEKLAGKHGYDFIENAPSHYHVAMWAYSVGYRFTDPEQAKTFAALGAGIKRLKDSGMQLTRTQESWVCVAQSLPVELIPKGLYLGGPKWPQDNIGPQNLWMNKPLNERAASLLPGAQPKK